MAMRALVQGWGCLDSAACVIATRWHGAANRGTLSKKMSGLLEWSLLDVIALQDASGRYPVLDILQRQRDEDAGDQGIAPRAAPGDLLRAVAAVAKETGEAVSALLVAQASGRAADLATAAVEIAEAIEILNVALAQANRLGGRHE